MKVSIAVLDVGFELAKRKIRSTAKAPSLRHRAVRRRSVERPGDHFGGVRTGGQRTDVRSAFGPQGGITARRGAGLKRIEDRGRRIADSARVRPEAEN